MTGTAQHYIRIGEAAQLLGVSEGPLRNWGRQGKIRTHRHPINRYRLYRKTDIEGLLAAIHASVETAGATGPYRRAPVRVGRKGK